MTHQRLTDCTFDTEKMKLNNWNPGFHKFRIWCWTMNTMWMFVLMAQLLKHIYKDSHLLSNRQIGWFIHR